MNESRLPLRDRLADRFRDPKGWLLDSMPWPLRRRYLAHVTGDRNVPDSVRLIVMRRPSRAIMEHARKLAQDRGWADR